MIFKICTRLNNIKYRIRNDFSIAKYTDVEILNVIKNDFLHNQNGTIKIINQRLFYKSLNKKPFFYHLLNKEFYGINEVTIHIENFNNQRKIILSIGGKQLIRNFAQSIIIIISYALLILVTQKSFKLFISIIGVSLVILSFTYFFNRYRFHILLKRIIIREELEINNCL